MVGVVGDASMPGVVAFIGGVGGVVGIVSSAFIAGWKALPGLAFAVGKRFFRGPGLNPQT